MVEPAIKKNKKKRFQRHKQKQKKQILTTKVNITKALKKKLKVKYFNYDKKSYYTNNCIKPLKN